MKFSKKFPTDVLYSLYQIMTEEEKSLILYKVPELYKDYEPKSNKILIIFKNQGEPIPEEFNYRFGEPIKRFIEIPKEFDCTDKQHHENITLMEPIRRQIRNLIPEIISIRNETKNPPPISLEFAVDLESDDIYTICDFYAVLYRWHFSGIEHFVNIYKKPREDFSCFTKSKSKTFGLLDACMSVDVQTVIQDASVNLNFNTPTFLLKTGQHTRSTVLFQDIDQLQRLPITSTNSSLKGISIVLPASESLQDFLPQRDTETYTQKSLTEKEKQLNTMLNQQYSGSRYFSILHSMSKLRDLLETHENTDLKIKPYHDSIVVSLTPFYGQGQSSLLSNDFRTGNEDKAKAAETFYRLFNESEDGYDIEPHPETRLKLGASAATDYILSHEQFKKEIWSKVSELLRMNLKLSSVHSPPRFVNLTIFGETDSSMDALKASSLVKLKYSCCTHKLCQALNCTISEYFKGFLKTYSYMGDLLKKMRSANHQ